MSSDKVSIGNHLLYARSLTESIAVPLFSFVNGIVVHMLSFVKTGKTLDEIEKECQ